MDLNCDADGLACEIFVRTNDVTNMRQNGVRRLLVYCQGLRCWHSATVDADFIAGDVGRNFRAN
jgi:hypothetical protein